MSDFLSRKKDIAAIVMKDIDKEFIKKTSFLQDRSSEWKNLLE